MLPCYLDSELFSIWLFSFGRPLRPEARPGKRTGSRRAGLHTDRTGDLGMAAPVRAVNEELRFTGEMRPTCQPTPPKQPWVPVHNCPFAPSARNNSR